MLNNPRHDRFGYYQVGDQKFYNKVLALEYATRIGQFPTWNYNNQVFTSVDWTHDLPFSLKDAYRMRAEQLREKYDYLVLFYSGGVDSHNILTTFLENNIKIDSVVVFGIFEFDHDRDLPINLEQYKVAIPVAQKYQDQFEVNVLDLSRYLERCYHQDWIYDSGTLLYPMELVRNMAWLDPSIQKWLDKGTTGLIKGIDKPRVIFENGRFYFGFLDTLVGDVVVSSLIDGKHAICDSLEPFYWTPDAPWLVAKQCQVIKNYIKNVRPDWLENLYHFKKPTPDFMQNCVAPIIYDLGISPGSPPNYFTLGKSFDSPIWNIKDGFFHTDNQGQLVSQKYWTQGINHLQSSLDPKFINDGQIKNGLMGFWSQWHDLGP